MKKALSILILVLISIGVFFMANKPKMNTLGGISVPSAPVGSTLNQGLMGWWTMDGGDTPWTSSTAATETDKTGNGNTGTLNGLNIATAPTVGKLGQALQFVSTPNNQYVSAADSATLRVTNKFTISTWVYPTSFQSDYKSIVVKGDNNVRDYDLDIEVTTGKLRLYFTQGSTNYIGFTGNSALPLNAWSYVVGIYDGTTMRLYVNGVADGTFSASGNVDATANAMAIGRLGAIGTAFFDGKIDDVRVYNRNLSTSEISQLYRQGQGTIQQRTNPGVGSTLSKGLLAHYSFDGANMVQNVADSSGAGNIGFLTNFTSTTTVPGKIGQALDFDATNDYVLTNSDFIGTTPDLTITAWIRPKTYAGAIITNNTLIFRIRGSGDNDLDYRAQNNVSSQSAANSVVLNKWQFVTLTRSGTTANFYVNGNISGTPNQINDAPAAGSRNVTVGGDTFLGEPFNGDLDDVRVYSRVLSTAEITRLYNLGQATSQRTQTLPGSTLSQGLVGYWSFNGQDMINNVTDRSGAGNNGNLSGQTSTTTITGKLGQGLYFDGVDDKVAVAGVAVTAPFTVSMWIRSDATTGTQALISDASTNHELLIINGTLPRFYWDGFLTAPTASLVLKKWEHFVAVINADGSGTHYIDGVAAGTFTGATASATFVSIGSEPSATRFNGGLDEFRIYNRALTASEVGQLYKNGI